jgi:glycosyltransferase involved in cell wall biosynthesis
MKIFFIEYLAKYKLTTRVDSIILSIIIPTYRESKTEYLRNIFLSLRDLEHIELIIVHKNSNDGTLELIKIILSESISRGKRLKEGFVSSKGKIILFHHPRSIIERKGFEYLIENSETLHWGGFTHKFDEGNLFFAFTSFYSNKIRADINKIFYLDHCIYARRTLLEITSIPEVEIFEDTCLSILLREIVSPRRLEFSSTTSTIRFRKNGILFQIILNQFMKLGFYLGLPLSLLNRIYEKSLELNSPSEKKTN